MASATETAPASAINWDDLLQREMAAYAKDSDEAQAQLKAHSEKMGRMMDEAREKMFGGKGQVGPTAHLPKDMQTAVKAIEQKLGQFPMLIPHVLGYINDTLKRVGDATAAALGPIPGQSATPTAEPKT